MSGYEPRDRSGPMDIDQHDPLERIAQFALPDNEEGPSRKRPHADLSSPTKSFHAGGSGSGHSSGMRFGSDTPFMFHLSSQMDKLPTKTWRPYDPSEWQPRNFGFPSSSGQACASGSGSGTRAYGEDVEMSDSPKKGGVLNASEENRPDPKAEDRRPTSSAETEYENKGKENDGRADGEARVIAKGGVKREMRRREKRRDHKQQQQQQAPGMVPGEPLRTDHQHHYNFHTHAPSLRHSEIPSLLIAYIQVFLVSLVVLALTYIAVHLYLTVQGDVQNRMQEVSTEILQEIAECSHLYLTNRCDPTLRVPAMDAPCKAWEACMNRDPTKVQRTSVLAETFAIVINSFVDPISWKTMGFTLTTLCFLIILTNSALWNLRSKTDSQHPNHPGELYPPPPPGYQYQHWQALQHPSNSQYSGLHPALHGAGDGTGMEPRQLEYKDKGKKWWKLG